MALAISLVLALPVPLDGCGVGLPVLAGIIGMALPPFLLAVQADLVILGVSVELLSVIFPPPLPLTIGPAANTLLGMIAAGLEDLLAVAATATHQAAPNQNASRPL